MFILTLSCPWNIAYNFDVVVIDACILGFACHFVHASLFSFAIFVNTFDVMVIDACILGFTCHFVHASLFFY